MKNVMGVIYTGEKDSFLRELTLLRAIAAMPVAGRYRVIDFLVSSMVGSGMRNVGVIMQKNYHSLMDHLGSGKEWDLHGKNDGLYILPPFLTRDNVGVYTGSLDALHSNMNYLRRSRQEYVLLCNSLIVFNANFTDMFKSYMDSGCDVMMLYTKDPEMQRPEYGTYLDIDATGKVVDIEIDPTKPRYENTSMDVILLRKDLLIDLVDRGAAHGYHDLVRDVLQRMARDAGLNLCGYEYKDICFRLDSVQSYFKFNLATLDTDVRHRLFQAIYHANGKDRIQIFGGPVLFGGRVAGDQRARPLIAAQGDALIAQQPCRLRQEFCRRAGMNQQRFRSIAYGKVLRFAVHRYPQR